MVEGRGWGRRGVSFEGVVVVVIILKERGLLEVLIIGSFVLVNFLFSFLDWSEFWV